MSTEQAWDSGLSSGFNSVNRIFILIAFTFFSTTQALACLPTGNDTNSFSPEDRKRHKRLQMLLDKASENLSEQPDDALAFSLEAMTLAKGIKNQVSESRALYYLAEASFNRDDVEEALNYYLESAALEKKLSGPSSSAYAERIGDAGFCYFSLDRYQEAMDLYNQSLELSLEHGNLIQAASMYSNIGSIYVYWGDFGKAIECNKLALEIDRQQNDSVMISTDLNNIGKIYEQWGRPDEAIAYYKESLIMARQVGNQSMIAVRLNNLGIVLSSQQCYDEALDYFHQALDIERRMGSPARIGRRLAYIGATLQEMKDYPSALSYLNQALPLLQEVGLPADLARIYNTFGNYYLATGGYSQAADWFSRSLDLSYKHNLRPLQIGNLEGLSESYEGKQEYGTALKTLRQMIIIRDSVFTQESNTRLAEFQARFENEKMRLENEVLKKDARIKRNWYIISAFIALIAIVVLFAMTLILRLRSRNHRQEQEMARQKAERLQMELDLKNKELTFKAMAIIQKNESVADVLKGLDQALKNGESVDSLSSILDNLRNADRHTSWKEFEIRFTQVHKAFYDRLNQKFPTLTPNERKLCAFLRLNMTTKDIAAITHQSVHSIHVARTRLRKKLNLSNSEENLITFLINL